MRAGSLGAVGPVCDRIFIVNRTPVRCSVSLHSMPAPYTNHRTCQYGIYIACSEVSACRCIVYLTFVYICTCCRCRWQTVRSFLAMLCVWVRRKLRKDSPIVRWHRHRIRRDIAHNEDNKRHKSSHECIYVFFHVTFTIILFFDESSSLNSFDLLSVIILSLVCLCNRLSGYHYLRSKPSIEVFALARYFGLLLTPIKIKFPLEIVRGSPRG